MAKQVLIPATIILEVETDNEVKAALTGMVAVVELMKEDCVGRHGLTFRVNSDANLVNIDVEDCDDS